MTDDRSPLLAPNRADQGADGTVRKTHYGQGVQPWDKTLASGWGPHAAAFCVLRYLGRDKAPEHSLESARWYYERLYAGAAGRIESPSTKEEWNAALMRIEFLLTQHQVARLRGSV